MLSSLTVRIDLTCLNQVTVDDRLLRHVDARRCSGSQRTDKSSVRLAWKAKNRVYHSVPRHRSVWDKTKLAISCRFSLANERQVLLLQLQLFAAGYMACPTHSMASRMAGRSSLLFDESHAAASNAGLYKIALKSRIRHTCTLLARQ